MEIQDLFDILKGLFFPVIFPFLLYIYLNFIIMNEISKRKDKGK